MRNGLEQMEEKRLSRGRGRTILPPRNPVGGRDDGPSIVIDEEYAPPAGTPEHVQPESLSVQSGMSDAPPSGAGSDGPDIGASAEPRATVSSPQQQIVPAVNGVNSSKPAGKRGKAHNGALPDLSIDWTDPMMHIVKPNRVAVDVSVETRFKAAGTAGSSAPGNTERVMVALTKHLAELPDLVLARRPEEQGTAEGFFVRRAPTSRTEPGVPVHLRPKVGEWEVLGRIEQWVTDLITAGHPGRRKATKSEIVTAALAVEYPPTT